MASSDAQPLAAAAVASSDAQPLAATTTSRNKNCLTSQLLEGIGGPACTRGPSRGASPTSCLRLYVLPSAWRGCKRTAEPSARVATKSTRSVMNARLGSFSGNTSAANSWMGVRKICLAWVWRAKCADLAKPRLVDLSCGGRQAPTAATGAPTLAAPPPPSEAEMSCHSPLEKRRIAALPRQPQKYCYQMLRQCSGIQ